MVCGGWLWVWWWFVVVGCGGLLRWFVVVVCCFWLVGFVGWLGVVGVRVCCGGFWLLVRVLWVI